MSDNIVLYGPGGASPVNLGSWLRADPGPDFGARGLLSAVEVENFGEGGAFIYERAGIRRMGFPLTLASGGAGLNLSSLESAIRDTARPGGYIDVQPENTPSSEAVRFDIVHGRWEPDYSIFHNRAARRLGNLLLDTQPYGYWPTMILLASGVSPSYADTFSLGWNPASVIGDAPAQVALGFYASVASVMSLAPTFGGAGQQFDKDGFWWSMARPSGATGFAVPSDLFVATAVNQNPVTGSSNVLRATVSQLNTAPFGAFLRLDLMASGGDAWKTLAIRQFAATQAAQFPGRYRVYGMFRWYSFVPSNAAMTPTMMLQVSLDEVIGSYTLGQLPLASANPVATLVSVVPSGGNFALIPDAPVLGDGGLGGATEPIFQLVDLGEHTFPPVASGAWSPFQLRLWGRMPTSFVGTFPRLDVGGFRFQALDGPAGIMPNGLLSPTTNNIVGSDGAGNYWGIVAHNNAVVLDSANARLGLYIGTTLGAGSNVASPAAGFAVDARGFYRGVLPQLAGTEMQLDVGYFDRNAGRVGATTVIANATRNAVLASVHYRPRFQFLKGL